STHDPTAPNYVPESLFLWQGWSLAVARPGENMPQPSAADPSVSETRIGLDVTFEARNLPRLRFGEKYEVRARLVDLAGNGLTLEQANAVLTHPHLGNGQQRPVLPRQDGFKFLRFEPIGSPVPVLRSQRQPGESVERVVLR